MKNKYRVHRLKINPLKEPELLEDFINNLKGEVISIIPNVRNFFLFYGARVNSVIIVEKLKGGKK